MGLSAMARRAPPAMYGPGRPQQPVARVGPEWPSVRRRGLDGPDDGLDAVQVIHDDSHPDSSPPVADSIPVSRDSVSPFSPA